MYTSNINISKNRIFPIKTYQNYHLSPIQWRNLPTFVTIFAPGAPGAAQRAVAGHLWPWGAEPDAAAAPAQLRRRGETKRRPF